MKYICSYFEIYFQMMRFGLNCEMYLFKKRKFCERKAAAVKSPPTDLKSLHAYPSPSAMEVFALLFIRYINQYKHHPPVTELFALLHIRSIQEPSLSRHFPYSESMFATFKIKKRVKIWKGYILFLLLQSLHFFFCKGYIFLAKVRFFCKGYIFFAKVT